MRAFVLESYLLILTAVNYYLLDYIVDIKVDVELHPQCHYY